MKNRILATSTIAVFVLVISSCGGPTCTICGLQQTCPICQRYTADVFYAKTGASRRVLIGFDGCVVVPANPDKTCDFIIVTSIQPLGFIPISATPESIDLNSPPGAFDFNGQGINGSWGMPIVDYYDGSGNWVGSVTAYSMSDGWCQASAPNFSQCYTGLFSAYIKQMTPNGWYQGIGTANFFGDGRDRPDEDGDGYTNDVDCDDFDSMVNPGQSPDCQGRHFDMNCDGIPDEQQCNLY